MWQGWHGINSNSKPPIHLESRYHARYRQKTKAVVVVAAVVVVVVRLLVVVVVVVVVIVVVVISGSGSRRRRRRSRSRSGSSTGKSVAARLALLWQLCSSVLPPRFREVLGFMGVEVSVRFGASASMPLHFCSEGRIEKPLRRVQLCLHRHVFDREGKASIGFRGRF